MNSSDHPLDQLTFIRRVLAVFETWGKSDVSWRIRVDDTIIFYAEASDVFWWGTADCEPIRPDDIEMLEQVRADLMRIEGDEPTCIAELYTARKRGMRPQGAWYKSIDKQVHHLFDACGPLRETGLGNPVKHPSEVTEL